jgi:hypothetical protein
MATVKDLILRPALRLARITLRSGRTPAARQLTEALGSLNGMLGRWSADRLTAYQIVEKTVALQAAKAAYTVGPGGDFDFARPQRIERANILTAADSRLQLEVLTVDEWADYQSLSAAGQPSACYLDGAAPLSTLRFRDVPDGVYTVELYLWLPFDRFASYDVDVELPPEYEEAIVYQLALRLAMLDGKPINPDVRETARTALAELEALHAPVTTMSCDPAIVTAGQVYTRRGRF